MTSAARHEFLHRNWGFKCTCDLCSDPVALAASDARRERIKATGTVVIKAVENQDFRDALELNMEMAEMIREEGLEAHMGDQYEALARLSIAVGDKEGALEWAKRALQEFDGFYGDKIKGEHVTVEDDSSEDFAQTWAARKELADFVAGKGTRKQ